MFSAVLSRDRANVSRDVINMLQQLIFHPVAALFLIVALGSALGKVRLAGATLGSSGVLFVALLFGHLGVKLPGEIKELGIILFVYAVGLQAGPRFFNQFRRRGILFAKIAVLVVVSGAVITWVITRLLGISPELAIGIYAGAMTSTPGLAAAMDASGDPLVGVGYGLAYPFGVIGVVLLVQLLPRALRIDLAREEQAIRAAEPGGKQVRRRQFYVTNPACEGKTLQGLQLHRISKVNISRILREGRITPARPDTRLEVGDVVMAVGQEEELDKLELVFGAKAQGEGLLETTEVVARDVFISNDSMTGRALAELGLLERYGVIITRVFREDMEFVPTGRFMLEIGDSVRVAGSKEDCENFLADAGQHEKRIHETSILALSLGIFAGMLLGYKEFSLPGGASFRLGLAGGPLFVGLVLAHYGRIGRLNIRIPRGAKYILNQLGLVFFLAGAGVEAGGSVVGVVAASGGSMLAAGAIITLGAALTGLLACRYLFRLDMLSVLGAVAGGMTSTPALGAITEATDSRQPLLAYTAVYPVALILITVICQFLFFLL
ncbi:MAG: YidE/YbjL duplication [Candidatus Glassbacteria bacterium]|nr:YidE/YbjL duplication [Candidatus Glassbacteria bacterium]